MSSAAGTPSKPVNIGSPRLTTLDSSEGLTESVHTPPDFRALRSQYAGTPPPPNIPLRTALSGPIRTSPSTPGESSPRPRPAPIAGLTPRRPAGAGTPGSNPDINALDLEGLTDEEKAKVVRKHLVSKDERENRENGRAKSIAGSASGSGLSRKSSSASTPAARREDTEAFPIPYHAPGADVTHDIYKWQSDQRRQAARPRAASFAGAHPVQDPAFEHIHEPGGFRRNYVLLRANEQGIREPRILASFIDFLFIFGHFAGEDLEEDEDDDKEDEDEGVAAASLANAETGQAGADAERQPLLAHSRSRSRSRRRRLSVAEHGDATVTQAILMLLKSFVGTGVLFLGKAFFNGGLLFSSFTLCFIALISLYSFLLLVKTKFVVSGSFGDIGGTLYGPWMRYAILSSIVVSQMGFVAAYTIFVAENLQAFILGVTNCLKVIPVQYLIFSQLIIFLPLALVRNLAKLSTTALVADAFILAGLLYIFGSEFAFIARDGIAEVQMFNAKDFPLFIGTAVFSFEGIGLVIPITDSMREPHKFPKVLTGVMLFLMVLFGGSGALAYLTFGSAIQTVVIVNLDASSKLVQTVQFFYAIAILLSAPLQLFPAVRIMENGLFSRSGKADVRIKWLKNLFRFCMVMICTGISWAGAADLDKFVSFIGSFACVPLCYIYPAMLHYKAVARTRREKLADIALMVFGLLAATYTTIQTIRLMLAPEAGGSPKFGSCDVDSPTGNILLAQ
ncbi:hypothetical protein PLICRDRAFT_45235 [Plicaturopsis crispa FD-325 SS-3]|uniref:Amino acid transporter transmembrane domain-containing protein n=1 Tax=Plicaturopsis crispa FD-325 SS-3 TaxID=944288 RepID=A0A0C9T723_PLICR|nr:hypothetical protein PLICRDRAFT_45235 [Plicaturopsis crispa FD-325 SS-3]